MSIRVLVVEDSLTVRMRLVEVLDAHPDFEVVGQASDGRAGIELCQKLRPDVVTLDMMLPIMSGLAATEYIMAYCPTPIVIVSASTNRGELFKTYEALAAGAVDVLDKPLGGEANEDWDRRLFETLRIASRIKVITHPRLRLRPAMPATALETPDRLASARSSIPSAPGLSVVALGASTGGPSAVLNILQSLPASFPLPILLVIHIGEPFGIALAEWLAGQVALPVRCAKDGERLPEVGRPAVLMAPPEKHLALRGGRVWLTNDPPRFSCRPSVDVLFQSVAAEVGAGGVGCLLTGMGRDGADGLLAMRRAGGRTIAQDETTCVVFGMPREAILLGAAENVLPLGEIAPALQRLVGSNGGGAS
jgi:two-component system chemotaxis response regulator CheB